MSEGSFDMVLRELRATAPPAPERLRERVSALPAAPARRSFRLRPALATAIGLAFAVGLGAAVIGGFTGSEPKPTLVGEFRAGAQSKEAQQYSMPGKPGYAWKAQRDARALKLAPTLGSG